MLHSTFNMEPIPFLYLFHTLQIFYNYWEINIEVLQPTLTLLLCGQTWTHTTKYIVPLSCLQPFFLMKNNHWLLNIENWLFLYSIWKKKEGVGNFCTHQISYKTHQITGLRETTKMNSLLNWYNKHTIMIFKKNVYQSFLNYKLEISINISKKWFEISNILFKRFQIILFPQDWFPLRQIKLFTTFFIQRK